MHTVDSFSSPHIWEFKKRMSKCSSSFAPFSKHTKFASEGHKPTKNSISTWNPRASLCACGSLSDCSMSPKMARHMKFGRVAVAEITMMVTSPHRTKRSSEILLYFSLRVGFYKFGSGSGWNQNDGDKSTKVYNSNPFWPTNLSYCSVASTFVSYTWMTGKDEH